MNVERYLLSTALTGIISQRLAKKICTKCRVERDTSKFEKKVFKKYLKKDVDKIWDANPDGCDACRKGYKGRVAIQEVLELDDEMRNALNDENLSKDDLSKLVYSDKVITMLQDALGKVVDGTTSFEEVLRVIEIEDAEDFFESDTAEKLKSKEKEKDEKIKEELEEQEEKQNKEKEAKGLEVVSLNIKEKEEPTATPRTIPTEINTNNPLNVKTASPAKPINTLEKIEVIDKQKNGMIPTIHIEPKKEEEKQETTPSLITMMNMPPQETKKGEVKTPSIIPSISAQPQPQQTPTQIQNAPQNSMIPTINVEQTQQKQPSITNVSPAIGVLGD